MDGVQKNMGEKRCDIQRGLRRSGVAWYWRVMPDLRTRFSTNDVSGVPVSGLIAKIFLLVCALIFAGCDKQNPQRDAVARAEEQVKVGAFTQGIRAYEGALDGTAKTAEIHYKIAVLYDDKLKEPLDAIHHYERYLEFAPKGGHAKEAHAAKEDCEKRLQAKLGKEGFMSTGEAARLRNENETLRKTIAELRNPKPLPASEKPDPNKPDAMPPGAKRYSVARGDTLAKIAVKFYNNRAYAGHIKDANFNQLRGGDVLQVGMILIIPESPGKKRTDTTTRTKTETQKKKRGR